MFNRPSSNFDLIEIGKNLLGLTVQVLMKDELKNNFKSGNYILNLENSYEDGSHWVGLFKKGSTVIYYDPYALPPPQEHFDIFSKKDTFYHNIRQHQHLNSILCGYFCLMFLFSMNKEPGKYIDRFNKFLNNFYSTNLKRNDAIVKQFFRDVAKKKS